MFPPDGADYSFKVLCGVEKGPTKIHDYMDCHREARYGYIVNDEELVFFRRRGTGCSHMDTSPATRHDTDVIHPGCNISTTKLVLFYFPLVIAPDQSKWKLASCCPLINLRPHLKRVAKGTVSIERNPPRYKKPDSDEDFKGLYIGALVTGATEDLFALGSGWGGGSIFWDSFIASYCYSL